MGRCSTKPAACGQTIETLGGDYALKRDDETQMSVNAHAAPGVKQSMSSYGRLATICNAMPAPVWRLHPLECRGHGGVRSLCLAYRS